MMSRKRLAWWSVAGVAAVALGIVAVEGEWIPGPKPSFPEGSGVRTYANENSLPPVYDSGVAVRAGGITRDWAFIYVYLEGGDTDGERLQVGDSATLAGVTITLCDTWVNRWADLGWSSPKGGSTQNASRIYYVQSTDGSIPQCP